MDEEQDEEEEDEVRAVLRLPSPVNATRRVLCVCIGIAHVDWFCGVIFVGWLVDCWIVARNDEETRIIGNTQTETHTQEYTKERNHV